MLKNGKIQEKKANPAFKRDSVFSIRLPEKTKMEKGTDIVISIKEYLYAVYIFHK